MKRSEENILIFAGLALLLFSNRKKARTYTKGLAYGRLVPSDLREAVVALARKRAVNIDPELLASALLTHMYIESAKTFSPSIQNKYGATGLIQFTKKTARDLGTTTEALANMSAIEQLKWVDKFYRNFWRKIRDPGDVRLAGFMPAGLGKGDGFILFAKDGTTDISTRDADWSKLQYRAHPNADTNKDGVVTNGEVREKLRKYLERGLSDKYRS